MRSHLAHARDYECAGKLRPRSANPTPALHRGKFNMDDIRRYETCIRCNRKIYPAEKSDVGVALHKSCFRCSECNVTLTLNGYIIAKPENANRKGVYCKSHAPKPVRYAFDDQAMEIMNAVKSQHMLKKPGFNKQVRMNLPGWQYDANAMEFQHAKLLIEQNKKPILPQLPVKSPADHDYMGDDDDLAQGAHVSDLAESFSALRYAQFEPDHVTYDTADVPDSSDLFWPPHAATTGDAQAQAAYYGGYDHCRYMDANNAESVISDSDNDEASAIYQSLNVVRQPSEPSPPIMSSSSADVPIDKVRLAEVLRELYRAESIVNLAEEVKKKTPEYDISTLGRKTIRGECFKEKRFVKQNELELRQRHEHSEMFQDFERSREDEVKRLEDDLRRQMDKAVKEVIYQMDQGLFQGDLRTEKLRIEQHFQQLKEEKMRTLLDQLNLHERMRIDEQIDKQTREMLELIDKKVPSQLPAPEPPKKRKSSLYDGPHVFDEVDFTAIQVAQQDHGSFTELVYDLTKDCLNQLEKVRAIFRWITVKDLNQMIFAEELTADDPYYFLKGIKYGLESYHELFKRICSYAGLKVRIIRGYSKSAGYKPGMPFANARFRNTWAVVYIDQSWRFIDCQTTPELC